MKCIGLCQLCGCSVYEDRVCSGCKAEADTSKLPILKMTIKNENYNLEDNG